MSSVKLFAQLK